MKVGMVGLGRMGLNMSVRLLGDGHEVVGMDVDASKAAELEEKGGKFVGSLEALVNELSPPRIVWLMLPAGDPTQKAIDRLEGLLTSGDVVVDGGNSHYTESRSRAEMLASSGIHFVDAGTSGGIWGLKEGYCLMVGGSKEAFEKIEPILKSLAPPGGYGRVGPPGAGHFVKMVHNGIEYGIMQAYGEGFSLLKAKEEFSLNLLQIARLWTKGSVIRSWLLELLVRALEDPGFEAIEPVVADTGEGRWTAEEALQAGVPAPVITSALFERYSSRGNAAFSNRIVAALRHQFGGHPVVTRSDG